jgi:hypothetical protein
MIKSRGATEKHFSTALFVLISQIVMKVLDIFGIIDICIEKEGDRMCTIIDELEKDFWDATNSWSGYNYQGKMALYVVLKKINELVDQCKECEIEDFFLELEWLEDFSILRLENGEKHYESIHQVKAKENQKLDDYEDALVKLYQKVINYKTIKNAYLHTSKEILYEAGTLQNSIDSLLKKCNQIRDIQKKIMDYKQNTNRKVEIEKIYKPGRNSDINNIIKNYGKKVLADEQITDENVDIVLDAIYEELQKEIELCKKGINKVAINKIALFEYPNNTEYCEINQINELIRDELNFYWKNTKKDLWRCSDSQFCEIMFLCLQGYIDRYITQRHMQYKGDSCKEINFNEFVVIIDSLEPLKRCEGYYIYKIKEKLLVMCYQYHEYCIEECDSEEEQSEKCKTCEVFSFYEKISGMTEAELRDFVHATNPNITKKISEMDWGDYCNSDRYINPFFNGLRDINQDYQKKKEFISYLDKEKKANLLTTVGNNDGSKKALMRACKEIVTNPEIYEVLMDYDCLISRELETESIYEGAGEFLKEFKIENNHVYHCKNLKMRPLSKAIELLDGGEK